MPELSLQDILQLLNQVPGQMQTEFLSPGVEAMKQAPLGSASPQPQPQIQPATIPQAQPDALQSLAQQINPKVIEQVIQQLQKDTLNTKPIGPDVIQGITGQAGQGGFFGLGIQPTDVLGFALGALLTRGLPTEKAIGTTMNIAMLPAQFRQQQRDNIKNLLNQVIGVAQQERLSNQMQPVAGGMYDPRTGQVTRTSPLARHEQALEVAQSPEDVMVALGLRQAPGLPGEAGRVETEREKAKEPGRVLAAERETSQMRERTKIQEESRRRLLGVAASLSAGQPTQFHKNLALLEAEAKKRDPSFKGYTREEVEKFFKSQQQGGWMDELMRSVIGSGVGGGTGAVHPVQPGGQTRLSPEGLRLLEEEKRKREGR